MWPWQSEPTRPVAPDAWASDAIAALAQEPATDEHACVVQTTTCLRSSPERSVIYPHLSAIIEDACVLIRAGERVGRSSANATAFAPIDLSAARAAHCRAAPDDLKRTGSLAHRMSACHPRGTAMLHPCAEPQSLDVPITRFCAAPLPRRPLPRGVRVHRVPLLFAELVEIQLHPENIGHFFRDLAFLAAMQV